MIRNLAKILILISPFVFMAWLISQPMEKAPTYDIWKDLNNFRVAKNAQPLTISQELCNYAAKRAREASINFSHEGFAAAAPFEYQGENLARNITFERLIQAWKDSPTHNEVMSNPIYDKGCLMCVDGVCALELAK